MKQWTILFLPWTQLTFCVFTNLKWLTSTIPETVSQTICDVSTINIQSCEQTGFARPRQSAMFPLLIFKVANRQDSPEAFPFSAFMVNWGWLINIDALLWDSVAKLKLWPSDYEIEIVGYALHYMWLQVARINKCQTCLQCVYFSNSSSLAKSKYYY